MAGLRELLTCAECSKQKREIKKYPRKEIINFNGRNLCPNCYKQAKENEEFKIFICEFMTSKPESNQTLVLRLLNSFY